MRAATFTASPMAVYSRRCGAPTSPTTTMPVCTPIPMRSGGSPRATRARLSAASASCMASAQCTARAAWSGCATGAPKYAMRPSPRYLSSVPPCAKTVSTMRAWYSFSMATTRSLASVSLNAVNSRRSLKRRVTSRLSPAPAATLLGGDVLDQTDRPPRGVDAHRRDAGDHRNGPCGHLRRLPGERGEPHFEGGADRRGEHDPPRPQREGRGHDEEHVEHRGRECRRGKAGSPGDDAGLQEVDERHVHEADVDAHQRGESGRPAGRPKDRRGDQPVGG